MRDLVLERGDSFWIFRGLRRAAAERGVQRYGRCWVCSARLPFEAFSRCVSGKPGFHGFDYVVICGSEYCKVRP